MNDFIIPEIFDVPGREAEKDQDISSKDLVRELLACGKDVQYAANLKEAEAIIRERLSVYDVILIVGAGDVYKIANNLVGK
jgi:UDP-N-acetylmuramate-alanine ligase